MDIGIAGQSCQLAGGSAPLLSDERIKWCASQIGGLHGKTVLELGPLEGGHTYMLEQMGASRILSIESNIHHFLKCLIVKDLLGLQRAQVLCGDFVEYLRADPPRYDLVLASGVLYHMLNPVELIALSARIADRVFIWTHYYDRDIIDQNAKLARKFSDDYPAEYAGFNHTLFRQDYLDAADRGDFCGASTPYSHWLPRSDIFGALRHFGLTDIRVGFDHPLHPHGPTLAIVAQRSGLNSTVSPMTSVPERVRRLRYLFGEAVRHYHRGGVRALLHETHAFWERRRAIRDELRRTGD